MSRHLLHIFPSFQVGGPQVRFAALAAGLGEQFSHTVLAMNGCYDAASYLPKSIDVQIGEHPSSGAFASRLLTYRRMLADLSPDMLVTYNWGAIEWSMANTLTGVRHIHIADGFGPEEADRQLTRRVWTRRVALRNSDVIVPSLVLKDIATRVWRLNPQRVIHIPNGIAPQDQYRTQLDKLGLDLPRQTLRIVWAGALRREKNPIRLLRAFAPLKDRAVLLIVGDGPERESIEREATALGLGSRCRLLGTRSDVRDLMMQCDVMAMSSDTEQMPIAVLEAMDAALPVASIDVGDVRRMVSEENRPFIVGPSDRALTEALRTLITDDAARKTIGAANRKRRRSCYGLNDMIARYGAAFGAPAEMRHA
jgi:glycosyltransferase involved in cell wall biosynthesis